jgi:hypothetical protein
MQQVAWQALLVTGMAGFMDDAHQALHEVIFPVAGGNAHIFRYATAEGMYADIQPASIKIESQAMTAKPSWRCCSTGSCPAAGSVSSACLAITWESGLATIA